MIDPAIRAESSAVHRALHKVDARAFVDALRAAESVAISNGLTPRAAADVERVVVHQVALALGVRT
ncbi:hypothetical protein UFOVP860_65 [uncultured Caudovirales phage]|uniref:Uncharacterized protein n=1 Tax=uncultured Caudovirales phage TaxID=2100421 RepID=A0A6J5RMX3_9CAUD|nr:hypothetical protein UFOVP860_65 [uncultured Caudovirales phage]CAB4195617.1 hypothetical protein UFOVP1293_46 [uncultured Caudovirales phage]CAB4222560.1 hypothetical protein UFOVP1644_64 [uncultured Caudovirales phage]